MKIVLHLHYIFNLADLSKFDPKSITKIEAIHFKVTVTSEVLEKSSKFGYNITSYSTSEMKA